MFALIGHLTYRDAETMHSAEVAQLQGDLQHFRAQQPGYRGGMATQVSETERVLVHLFERREDVEAMYATEGMQAIVARLKAVCTTALIGRGEVTFLDLRGGVEGGGSQP